MQRNRLTYLGGAAVIGVLVAGAVALPPAQADHNLFGFGVLNAPTATTINSGGEGATWEVVTSLTSGNPHTDLDFFRVDGDFYVAVGTLAIGPNAGGQAIHRLTVNGELDPQFVSAHPSAACITDPTQATALQHDVEVTPKGDVMFNTDWKGLANTGRPQLLLDATDGPGRCHDQGPVAVAGGQFADQPPGGLEIVDITDLASPVEIGLTSHIGEAHTVNVDPKRPHIAYAVTADYVTVANRPDASDPNRSDQDLDGFELVDLSSCMNFPAGTDVATKREQCRPQVYRYRFEVDWSRGTFDPGSVGACHELELWPDDRLTCAGLNSSVVLDMSGAFDDNGTPDDFTDDVPRGVPLPCSVRASASNEEGLTGTDAMVTDCVTSADGQALNMSGWLEMGAPSLEGVSLVGFINHAAATRGPADDIAISHEAEFTHSGRHLIVSDERGGGLLPPDASCPTPGINDNAFTGNGGLHAYTVDQLFTEYPGELGVETPEQIAANADRAYALTPDGGKAVYRAIPRISGATFCTAHVFQQIPGQNRVFMGWYTQGTQVVDYIEHEDGSFEWVEAAYWVPEASAQWTSHIFAMNENADGTYTYFGATSDIVRTAVDIYSVTLPPPPQFAPGSESDQPARSQTVISRGGAAGWLLLALGLIGLARRRG